MKIYKHDYIKFIRLTFKRKGDENLYLPLVETTLFEAEEMVRDVIRTAKIDPLIKCFTTTIEIREATGGKNGSYTQVSFKGLSPQEIFDLITKHINQLNHSN